ncbi:UDP-glucose 6-dehydrogenase [Rickettsia prowazekii str. GvF12]|nr:UDP-glucose 6-dehydrogenase [Rickettsia prowazekii str. GvF12]
MDWLQFFFTAYNENSSEPNKLPLSDKQRAGILCNKASSTTFSIVKALSKKE